MKTRTKTKIYDYGIDLAQRSGRWSILDENLLINGKNDNHNHIKVKCECGTKSSLRLDFFKYKKSLGCRHCLHKINYPSNRKSISRYYKGLNYTFLSRLKYLGNLYRGRYKVLTVTVTIEDLYNKLLQQNFKCALSGLPLNVLNLSNIHQSNASIDRIDSSGNYIPENVQWVCKDINRMKNSIPQEHFINLCKLVSETNSLYDNSEPS